MVTGGSRARWVRAPHDVAYRHVRDNVTELVRQNDGQAEVPVPACPGWTVADLVAHVVQIGWKVAVRSGMAPSPPLPAEGADPRSLVALWQAIGATVDQVLREHDDQRNAILVMDAFTHELDIRKALGLPVPGEHPALCGSLELLNVGFDRSVRGRGLPPLRISTEGREWVAGERIPWDAPIATLTADRHELHRSLAGRRTLDQIAALDWSEPADPWLPAFTWGPFHPPTEPVEQARARGTAA